MKKKRWFVRQKMCFWWDTQFMQQTQSHSICITFSRKTLAVSHVYPAIVEHWWVLRGLNGCRFGLRCCCSCVVENSRIFVWFMRHSTHSLLAINIESLRYSLVSLFQWQCGYHHHHHQTTPPPSTHPWSQSVPASVDKEASLWRVSNGTGVWIWIL